MALVIKKYVALRECRQKSKLTLTCVGYGNSVASPMVFSSQKFPTRVKKFSRGKQKQPLPGSVLPYKVTEICLA